MGFHFILRKINKRLLEQAEVFNPDILLVFKGMEILPETLAQLKNRGVKLVNFNPDNPFIFSGRGSGNRYVRDSVSLFDLYFSYDASVVNVLTNEYKVHSRLLPFGFDLSDSEYSRISGLPEVMKSCFIGNYDHERLHFLNRLAFLGAEFDLYGSNWPLSALHSNISYKGYVQGERLWENLSRYRVQLNLLRKHNCASHNMRTFEIAAAGGIQLAPYSSDHILFFEPGKEIFIYRDADDCMSMINELLTATDKDAHSFRENARFRCVQSGYSYKNRVQEMVTYIHQLFN